MDGEMRAARADDVPAIGALIRRAEAHDGVPRSLADEELADDLAAAHIDRELDTRVVEVDGELAGMAYVWNPEARHRLDRAQLFGEVAPEHRGRGIGRALLGWSVDRARERLVARRHDLPRFIRVNTYDWLDDRCHLYERVGFAAVRWHDVLIRRLDDLPAVEAPEGVTLLPWPADREEELRTVRNASFGDHWGTTIVEPQQWRDYLGGHGTRLDLSVVAVDDSTGEVLGLCINHAYPEDEAVTGRRDAWVANVATLRAARGRGVGSAMLAWSLRAFADAGFSHAMLDVDTDNPTGAARLYRSLGFDAHHRTITYEIELVT